MAHHSAYYQCPGPDEFPHHSPRNGSLQPFSAHTALHPLPVWPAHSPFPPEISQFASPVFPEKVSYYTVTRNCKNDGLLYSLPKMLSVSADWAHFQLLHNILFCLYPVHSYNTGNDTTCPSPPLSLSFKMQFDFCISMIPQSENHVFIICKFQNALIFSLPD